MTYQRNHDRIKLRENLAVLDGVYPVRDMRLSFLENLKAPGCTPSAFVMPVGFHLADGLHDDGVQMRFGERASGTVDGGCFFSTFDLQEKFLRNDGFVVALDTHFALLLAVADAHRNAHNAR